MTGRTSIAAAAVLLMVTAAQAMAMTPASDDELVGVSGMVKYPCHYAIGDCTNLTDIPCSTTESGLHTFCDNEGAACRRILAVKKNMDCADRSSVDTSQCILAPNSAPCYQLLSGTCDEIWRSVGGQVRAHCSCVDPDGWTNHGTYTGAAANSNLCPPQ